MWVGLKRRMGTAMRAGSSSDTNVASLRPRPPGRRVVAPDYLPKVENQDAGPDT